MMELDYSKIHHSRKICGTEQAEFIEDKRLRDILTMGLYKNEKGSWEALSIIYVIYKLNKFPLQKGTVNDNERHPCLVTIEKEKVLPQRSQR